MRLRLLHKARIIQWRIPWIPPSGGVYEGPVVSAGAQGFERSLM